MNTQSIIVYRNPAEAAFWESGMAFPLMSGLFVGFIVFVIGATILDKFTKKSWKKPVWWEVSTWTLAIASLCLAGYVFHTLAN